LIQPLHNENPTLRPSSSASSRPDPTELNNALQGKPILRATAILNIRIIPTKSERNLLFLE
jgi:hypothetical protein